MLAWLLGAETSFTKALLYNMLTCAVLMCFGAIVYAVLVGFPTAVATFANKK